MSATGEDRPDSGAPPAEALHEAILQTLASAVISLRPDGVITTFNAAAAAVTGLTPAAVVQRTFAEVFLGIEDAEDFAQAVLDAVYKGPLVRQRVIEADFGGGARDLSMSVSRIASDDEADAGVAVVFEDITEIRELRAKELALAQEVEAQHKELRSAYLRLEERNRTLAEANRQTRFARIIGLGAVVVLLSVAGFYVLDLRPQAGNDAAETPAAAPTPDEAVVLTVAPQAMNRTITLTGQLAPRREVDITSPISGKIAAVHVRYGARVEAGQALVELDPTDMRIDHRDAQARHIKAVERLAEVENWNDGVEASRARRSVARAKLDLEDSRARLEETAFLLERGVIPSSEHTAAQRGFTSRQLDLEAAEQDLASVMHKGAAEVRVAQLELANARARLDELTENLRLSVLKAPVAGVVMRPPAAEGGGGGGRDGRLASGDAVTQGERLMIVGDLEGLAVDGRIDEVDIINVSVGNEVRVSGDAFPNTVLLGTLERVSSEATAASRSLPFFEVTAVVPSLTPSQRAAVRIGMSAVLEVVIRREAEALLVPLAAIALVGSQPTVHRVGDDGPIPVPVVVGETTVGQIEILEGVAPGDRILVMER
ncbi:MAG: efflux RND transporter periplasmic adaptor subunit [Gammaproteobacteria bacterium]|nr:efflux RND transporter periplasmic adaptor subunit [Gammaproteobacteria bacterium]